MTAVSVLTWGPVAAQTPVPCGEASLRAAIDGASTGAILILPDRCTIRLTGAPGEENNQSGDLDVNVNTAATSLTIQGAGPGRTTNRWRRHRPRHRHLRREVADAQAPHGPQWGRHEVHHPLP